MVEHHLAATRSQAEHWIKLGKVTVDGTVVTKPGYFVRGDALLELRATEQYVSRAGLKLASVASKLGLDFRTKIVLDVGSSTGGFTDYALQHGAKKVIAVDVGTEQLHPSLRANPKVELYEQTDIRSVRILTNEAGLEGQPKPASCVILESVPNLVLIDVSFISLREVLPHVATLTEPGAQIVAMVKPQFEAGAAELKHKGVIKNDRMRRDILKQFEEWAGQRFVIVDKADSDIAGAKGNLERFYLLQAQK